MQNTNDTHKALLSDIHHWTETRVVLVNHGVIADEKRRAITIGGVALQVSDNTPDNGHDERELISLKTVSRIYSGEAPAIGGTPAAEIDLKMMKPWYTPPKMGCIKPFQRLTNGARFGNWIQKGVFWIDTRTEDVSGRFPVVTYHGYDSMIRAEIDCPVTGSYSDIALTQAIAAAMGVAIAPGTLEAMTLDWHFDVSDEYSAREVLGYVAGTNGGCFLMDDLGRLKFISMRR